MKFKVGDKVRRISHKHPYDPTHTVGSVHVVDGTMKWFSWYSESHTYSEENYELVVEPTVPVFDRYFVYAGGLLVANYSTFDEADTRARGLAEGGKITTVKDVMTDKLIATYQRPVPPVEVIFADKR